MTAEQQRDYRRMDAYRQFLRPESNASENERAQAAARLKELEERWANAGKEQKGPTFTWHSAWGDTTFYGFGGGSSWGWGESSEAKAAREARERQWAEDARRAEFARKERERVTRIARQRHDVEQIPFWRTSPTLALRHAADGVWTSEERAAFDAERNRTYGTKAEPPDVVAALLHRVATAWTLPMTDEERAWLRQDAARLLKHNRLTALGLAWLAFRVPGKE